jgi:hypothetical protein
MRVTVIPVDKTIIIDGNGVILESWPFEDDDIHAIQWEHNKGHIELKTNDPNIDLDDIDIVQPYIDEYMKVIPLIEQKVLLEQEEQKIRLENEEREKVLAEESKRKEQQEIQNLIDQNKKIREEKLKLEAENSTTLEKLNNVERHYDLELEKKEFEKQIEIDTLKNKEIIKLIKEKDAELVKKYESLASKLDDQKTMMEEEQRSFINLIDTKQQNIDLEKEQLEEKRKILNEEFKLHKNQIDHEREELEHRRYSLLTENEYQKQVLLNMKEQIEYEDKHLQKMKEIHQKEITQSEMMLSLKEQEYDNYKNRLEIQLQEIAFAEEQNELEKIQKESTSDELGQILELKKEFWKDTEIIKNNWNDNIRQESLSSLLENKSNQEVTLEQLSNILEELDPEKVYNTLTNKEISKNDFPVEKAVVWFSALKKVIDKNSNS